MVLSSERWQRLESLFYEAIALSPEEREAFLAERCAGDEADAFFFRGQYHVDDLRIALAQRDELAVPGIGHIADLANADAAKMCVDRIGPGCRDVCWTMQGRSR
jgi:hypothetical protein